ncbi:MAG: hypothetical protein HOP18_02915 [Deltaproteobacteria bacterium]|nr:hypothetical protein [Deltaproteobacteria bacterium]
MGPERPGVLTGRNSSPLVQHEPLLGHNGARGEAMVPATSSLVWPPLAVSDGRRPGQPCQHAPV